MKMPIPDSLSRAELKDLAVLVRFTAVYCRCHHADEKAPLVMAESAFSPLPLAKYPLCGPCREFLRYALIRRLRCPLEPNPACKLPRSRRGPEKNKSHNPLRIE
ncbi:MAG: hypothetical protein P8X63_15130 [Desulfuromonadaceae bacterium]